jgi:hypothetical protein
MHRYGVRQTERIGAGLAVTIVDTAVLHGDALDAAREVDRPGDGAHIIAADLLDGGELGLGEVLVPAQPLEHRVGELRIAVLDLGSERVRAFGEEIVLLLFLDLDAVLHDLGLDHTFDAEAGAERAAAIHDMEMSVVELVSAGMLELGTAPARPRQAVVVALGRTVGCPQRNQFEVLLVRHVELEPLR